MKKNMLIAGIAAFCGLVIALYYMAVYNVQVPAYVYKIVSVEQWVASQDQETIVLSEMDTAFIHLATAEQVQKVIATFWPDAREIVVLKLASAQLPGKMRYERNPGGTTKYYHLYNGSIPHAAIVEAEVRKLQQ